MLEIGEISEYYFGVTRNDTLSPGLHVMRLSLRASLPLLFIFSCVTTVLAQDNPDLIRAKGDFLTGVGNYLQGVAWYEVGTAEARAINADTEIKIRLWNERVYENYKRELAEKGSKLQQGVDAIQRKAAEHQYKLRTNPSAKEVLSGEALNVLVLDLGDPKITDAVWSNAKIPLSPGISVRELMFKLVASEAGKANNATIKGVIALSRLDRHGLWPIFLRDDALAHERSVYEKAYQEVKEKSFVNKLDLTTVSRMDEAIDRLRAKANQVVPVDREFRKEALAYIDGMKSATAMFNANMIDFAQEMIRDTKDHDAQTVAQLMAFMRKYQLIFADASGSPSVGELYRALLPCLLDQKVKLGLKDVRPMVADVKPIVIPSVEGRWTHRNVTTNYQMEVYIHKDGTYSSSNNDVGSWKKSGSTVIFQSKDQSAPGGIRVIRVELSQDGLRYFGKNNLGHTISGSRESN